MATPKKLKRYKCRDCRGLGYKEYEHGLIRLPCQRCNGTGVVTKELT